MDLLNFAKSPILGLLRKPQRQFEIDKLTVDSPEYWTAIEGLAKRDPSQLIPLMQSAIAKRAYDGMQVDRLTNDWATATGASVDSEVRGGYRILRNRARELVRNNDHVRNAKRKIANNVIGAGFAMQSQCKYSNGILDERTNTLIEDAWNEWCEAQNCDVSGRLTFAQIQRLAYESMVESGDVLIRIVRKKFGNSQIPIALEIIESDQLADDWTFVNKENNNNIRMGVELDEWKRPVAYWIRKYHPGDYAFNYASGNVFQPERVDASDIIHLFNTERPGQTRGITWFYSTLIRAKNISEYEKALMVRARFEACLMAFKTTPDPQMNQDPYNPSIVSEYLEPGLIKQLPPGDTITPYSPPSSFANAVQYLDSQHRGAGIGLGLPYESYTGDFSKTNYSSGRMSELESRRNWKILQQDMKNAFHIRIFKVWLESAVLSQAINLPRYFTNPKYYCCPKFFPPGFSTVDIEKEVGANAEGIKTGQTTLTKVLADLGVDIEESLRERRREIELAKSLGVDITSYIDKGVPQNAAGNTEGNEDQGTPISVSGSATPD
jgi:lambda family phage portal protein